MRTLHTLRLLAAAAVFGAGLTACTGTQSTGPGGSTDAGSTGADTGSSTGADAGMPSVTFTGLTDGAEVTSPAKVCLEVTGVTIEPSGEVKAGSGHNHVIVDPTEDEKVKYATGTTDPIAKDATHLHMGDGSSCVDVTLTPGAHELMAVVADGAHVPLNPPVVAAVKITAK